jgi:hypothetical protein
MALSVDDFTTTHKNLIIPWHVYKGPGIIFDCKVSYKAYINCPFVVESNLVSFCGLY